MELRPKSFFGRDQDRKRLVPLISGFKALTEGIYQNGNIKIPKQKKVEKEKKSERISQHPRSVAYRRSYNHRFAICQECNIEFSRATPGTSASNLIKI